MRSRAVVLLVTAALAIAACARRPAPPGDMQRISDERLRAGLSAALARVSPDGGLAGGAHVYRGRGFVVGFVSGDAERLAVLDAARGVDGLGVVEGYLPARPASLRPLTEDRATRARVLHALARAGFAAGAVTAEVLGGQVVLLGVVGDAAAEADAVRASRAVDGVRGVRSFLVVPDAEDAAALPPAERAR